MIPTQFLYALGYLLSTGCETPCRSCLRVAGKIARFGL